MAVDGCNDSSDGGSGDNATGGLERDLHLALYKFNGSEEQRCDGSSDHSAVEHARVGKVSLWMSLQFRIDAGSFESISS